MLIFYVLDQFHQNAARPLGVHEGNETVRATSRLVVDQLNALTPEIVERLLDVIDGEGHMVQALSPRSQEAGDPRVLTGRRDQLEKGVAGSQKCNVDLLLRRGFSVHQVQAKKSFEPGDGFVEIGNRNGGMVDASGVHSGMSRRRAISANPASIDDSAPKFREAMPSVIPSRHRPVVGSYIVVRASLRP